MRLCNHDRCFDCHKLMAVDRSSRKSLHIIELSRTIPNKPHKFVEGICFFRFFLFFFVRFCLFVCWFVFIVCSGFVFCLFNSFGGWYFIFRWTFNIYESTTTLYWARYCCLSGIFFTFFLIFYLFYFALCGFCFLFVLFCVFCWRFVVYLYFIVFCFVFVCFCFVFVFVCFLFIVLFILMCIVLLSYSTLH